MASAVRVASDSRADHAAIRDSIVGSSASLGTWRGPTHTTAPRPNGRPNITLSQVSSRIAGRAAIPIRKIGAPARRAICRAPGAMTSFGPRGPSGVTISTPPLCTWAIASRKAATAWRALRLAPFLAVDIRMAGNPFIASARATNSPSADGLINALVCFRHHCGATARPIGMRPCHRSATAPPSPARTGSTHSRLTWRQLTVARTMRM